MNDEFIQLLIRLAKAKVDFVIIGGFAAAFHGCTIVTQDIDICCDFQPDNLLRLQEAVADLHPVHRMTVNRIPLDLTKENCGNLKNLYLDTDLGQLDCLGFVQGVGDFSKVKEQSIQIEIDNHSFRVLRLDALIESKQSLGRPRDREMAQYLQSLKQFKQEKPNETQENGSKHV